MWAQVSSTLGLVARLLGLLVDMIACEPSSGDLALLSCCTPRLGVALRLRCARAFGALVMASTAPAMAAAAPGSFPSEDIIMSMSLAEFARQSYTYVGLTDDQTEALASAMDFSVEEFNIVQSAVIAAATDEEYNEALASWTISGRKAGLNLKGKARHARDIMKYIVKRESEQLLSARGSAGSGSSTGGGPAGEAARPGEGTANEPDDDDDHDLDGMNCEEEEDNGNEDELQGAEEGEE